jgi:hypothetical protein
VHGALGYDMDRFIRDCAHLFHDRQLRGHLSLFFCTKFFRQCVNIVSQCVLASIIEENSIGR